MTRTRIETPNDTQSGVAQVNSVETADPSNATSPSQRRPYHKPQLRVLGSVRDLTFGSPVAGINDFMGGNVRVM